MCATVLNGTYHSLAFCGFQSLLTDFVNSLDLPHSSTLTRITGEGVLNPASPCHIGDARRSYLNGLLVPKAPRLCEAHRVHKCLCIELMENEVPIQKNKSHWVGGFRQVRTLAGFWGHPGHNCPPHLCVICPSSDVSVVGEMWEGVSRAVASPILGRTPQQQPLWLSSVSVVSWEVASSLF